MIKPGPVYVAVAAVTLLLVGSGRAAAQTLDTTLNVRSGARLSVSNLSGTITIQSWRRSAIRVEAEYDQARVEIDDSPSHVRVRTVARRGHSEVDYVITVPERTAVEAGGISSDIQVEDVCGEAILNSVSGDVSLRCAEGDVTVQSVSGDVMVADVRGRVDVGSTSGDVAVSEVRGEASARSVSGEILLDGIEGDAAEAETVSGDIVFAGPIRERGRYRFESHSGDVIVRVAGNLNATIGVSTFSGELESDFPIVLSQGGRAGREWEFTLGSGSARLNLRSFSGTIYLRRGTGARPRREE
jgi:DUF4097 and DUF4098 domain-containing protein YvlB